MKLLFNVAETFVVTGRGLALVPSAPPATDERASIGDLVVLKRPGLPDLEVAIGGLGHITPVRGLQRVPVFLVDLEKPEVPIGTEVWRL